jgi:1-acyl-sn-glycerol-3-phosphate acyltransferase
MIKLFRRIFLALYDFCFFYSAILIFGISSLIWTALVLIVLPLLPRRSACFATRVAIMGAFRYFIAVLRLSGRFHFELDELDKIGHEKSLIIACNHPSLWDAMLIVSRLPNAACVMKAQVINNLFIGTGARLARYIRNESPRQMIMRSVDELQSGSQILIFPEGTRTVTPPLNPLKSSIGVIANRAQVPIQTVIIESDSPFLSKGWSLFKKPALPMTWRVRLGERFQPGADTASMVAELEQYFKSEIGNGSVRSTPAAASAEAQSGYVAKVSKIS